MLRAIIRILLSVLLTIAGIELMLRAFDPLGVVYADDFTAMQRIAIPAPHGYTLETGLYHAAHWSYVVKPDGNRRTPGRTLGGPRVTFVGDSVTFGFGVSDREVWVSRIAAAYGIDAHNAGRTAYSTVNVNLYLHDVRGCVVFLSYPNDPFMATSDDFTNPGAYDTYSFLTRTLTLLKNGKPTVIIEPFNPVFDAAMRDIAGRPDTLILAFDDDYGRAVADAYGAVLIPWYTHRVSFADPHANAEGNEQIAIAAAPVIAKWLEGRDCN